MIYRLLLLSDQAIRMEWLSYAPRYAAHPNGLLPAILRTCHIFHDEAMGVLYGENVFRALRNTASINRVRILIREAYPDDATHYNASRLPEFLDNHPNLEHLVLEFDFSLLEDSNLREDIRNMLSRSYYSSRLTVRSAFRSTRSCSNAAQLRETVDSMALMRNELPEGFKIFSENLKKVQGARLLGT